MKRRRNGYGAIRKKFAICVPCLLLWYIRVCGLGTTLLFSTGLARVVVLYRHSENLKSMHVDRRHTLCARTFVRLCVCAFGFQSILASAGFSPELRSYFCHQKLPSPIKGIASCICNYIYMYISQPKCWWDLHCDCGLLVKRADCDDLPIVNLQSNEMAFSLKIVLYKNCNHC